MPLLTLSCMLYNLLNWCIKLVDMPVSNCIYNASIEGWCVLKESLSCGCIGVVMVYIWISFQSKKVQSGTQPWETQGVKPLTKICKVNTKLESLTIPFWSLYIYWPIVTFSLGNSKVGPLFISPAAQAPLDQWWISMIKYTDQWPVTTSSMFRILNNQQYSVSGCW